MADDNPSADAAAGSETRDNAAAAPEAGAPGEPSAVGETIDPNDHARVAAEYKDKLLRVLAEMENLRRRTAREIADADKPSILRGYLKRWKWEVGMFFDAGPDGTDEELARIAPGHPVFRIDEAAQS